VGHRRGETWGKLKFFTILQVLVFSEREYKRIGEARRNVKITIDLFIDIKTGLNKL